MKILIVDDEAVSRKKMQNIMEDFGECEIVESGEAAVTAFRKAGEDEAPFDLITLDISMPDMGGIEVLHEIRKTEKEVPKEKQVRVWMVTSHSDKDTIIACIEAGCNDYIAKPFKRKLLIEKLKKIGLLSNGDKKKEVQASSSKTKPSETKPPDKEGSIVEKILSRFKRGEIDLPVFPQVGLKFKEMIKKGADLQAVAGVLKQDIAISSKLINVSNSTYYRGVEESKTLDQAISRLGIDVTKQYVNAICNRSLYSNADKNFAELVESLWKHSLACAYASQIISASKNLSKHDDIFTMGLLHDIGKLALFQVFSEMGIYGKSGEDIDETELFSTLDTLHNKFGAVLLKKWGFSPEYIQIAKFHDDLEAAESIKKNLLVVHFANLLVKSMGYSLGPQTETDLENTESARFLKLDPAKIDEFEDQIKEYVEGLKNILT